MLSRLTRIRPALRRELLQGSPSHEAESEATACPRRSRRSSRWSIRSGAHVGCRSRVPPERPSRPSPAPGWYSRASRMGRRGACNVHSARPESVALTEAIRVSGAVLWAAPPSTSSSSAPRISGRTPSSISSAGFGGRTQLPTAELEHRTGGAARRIKRSAELTNKWFDRVVLDWGGAQSIHEFRALSYP